MREEIKAIIPTDFGLNCDYETEKSFEIAGAKPEKVYLADLYGRKINQ